MIIATCPLRVSFTGGGSDLPFFYKRFSGEVVSAAIDKYVHVIIKDRFEDTSRISYSETEIVSSHQSIKHPIVRAVLEYFEHDEPIEIISIADIPSSGSGLGSSSSFTCALIAALSEKKGIILSQTEIAKLACEIEIVKCGSPIGKQDQYGCAIPGFKKIRFAQDDTVKIEKIETKLTENVSEFFQGLRLYYTGVTRSANNILGQVQNDQNLEQKLNAIKNTLSSNEHFLLALEKLNVHKIGDILSENWRQKQSLSSDVTSQELERFYQNLMRNGAHGAKLLGAGGGGFFLCLGSEHFHSANEKSGDFSKILRISIDNLGVRVCVV